MKTKKAKFAAAAMSAIIITGLSGSALSALAKNGADDPAGDDRGGATSSSSSKSSSSSSKSSKSSSSNSGKSTSSVQVNQGPGSVNSNRGLQNEVRGQGQEVELRGRETENEIRGQEAEARGRVAEQEFQIEDEIRREIQNEARNRGEVEIRREDGSAVRLRSEDALAHRSTVASAITGLLTAARELQDSGDDKGLKLGTDVRVIAQEQNVSRKKIADSLNKIETRGGFKKFMLGADFKEIKNVKAEIKANENRINKLTKLEADIQEPEVKSEIEKEVQVLETENQRLQADVQKAADGVSMFGWLVKMFSQE